MQRHLKFGLLTGMIALTGAATGILMFRDPILAMIAGMGAFVGGAVCAPMFTRQGPQAPAWSLAGAILSTALGAGIAGALLGGFPGMLAAAVAVFVGLTTHPLTGAVWATAMISVHLVGQRGNRERGN